MTKLYRKNRKVGLPPGTLLPVDSGQKVRIHLIDYNDKELQEKDLKTVEESFYYRDSPTVSWINIDGRDINIIRKIDEHYRVHPLVLEDIMNTGQRPKIEDYSDYLFFVLRMIYLDEKTGEIDSEQVSLVLGRNFVLSFQEKPGGDIFDPIRQRLRDHKGRVRGMGADYLVYTLLDTIVDYYFVLLERLGEKIDILEKALLVSPSQEFPIRVHKIKTQMIFLRKQIWPLREVLSNFERSESTLIQKETKLYIRDVYDHTIQINDTLEAFRDSLTGMHDIYLSSMSNRMNEIMKVLTVFSAVFSPLTFIVGIYGMNFDHMPELHWKYSYFLVLMSMALISVIMVAYFKKRKWI